MNSEIQTIRTLLRKYTDDDREIIADFFTDGDIGRYMGDGPSDTRKDAYILFDKIFEVYEAANKNRHFEVWGIEYQNELIGHIELKETENTLPNELEIVYLLDKPYWNKGIMTEILLKMKEYTFELNKTIIATVKSKNQASIRILEKLGIKKLAYLDKQKEVLKITLNDR